MAILVDRRRSPLPRTYTPKHLAERILTSRSALEGERKQVTVLFVDVSGFTSIASRLDPEEVHALMARAFELMLAEVHRYEGTVNQFLGDGIMALFGAPIAHEDHAQRAVHAALGIRAALADYRTELKRERGIEFQVRQGLNTGLVVVGSIGSDLRMDYTAVGDTTNVAARLLQAAVPGQVVISEAVQRAVGGYFETEALGPLRAQGEERGGVGVARAWRARDARTRLAVEAERGLTSFVGRERELSVLQDCFAPRRGGTGPGGPARGRAGHRQVATPPRISAPDRRPRGMARGTVPLLRTLHGVPPSHRPAAARVLDRGARLGSGHRR